MNITATNPAAALKVFDGLSDQEFDFLEILVKPRGITREQYRDELAASRFDARSFLDDVHAMRVAVELADTRQARRGPQSERPKAALRLVPEAQP